MTDLALQAERTTSFVPESIGLCLLEPRPRTLSSGALSVGSWSSVDSSVVSVSNNTCSLMEFMHESEQREVILDGIFEVLERGGTP